MDTQGKSIYLLDAYALIYRAYYAFIRAPRLTRAGSNVSAVYGFVNSLTELLTKQKPDFVAVAFDTHSPTFRHRMYDQYKANRDEQPEGIRSAVPIIKQMLAAMNICTIELEGYEADDLIGTVARRCEQMGMDVFMMTPDKDYAQLVTNRIRMFKPKSNGNEVEVWGPAEVCAHFGISRCSQVIDILGLWGDSADNIPGCPGVGEKKARELLGLYDSIDGIYANLDAIGGKLHDKLQAAKDQVMMSRTLATICTEAPVDFDIERAQVRRPDRDALQKLFAELEFRNIMPRIDSIFATEQPIGGLFDQPGLAGLDAMAPRPADLATAATTPHTYRLLTEPADIAAYAAELAAEPRFCFDTETTSVCPAEADIVGLAFATRAHSAVYIAIPPERERAQAIIGLFADVFACADTLKIGQNIKFDLQILANYGIAVRGPLFDTMVAHFLLYPNSRHNMDAMAEAHLGYRPIAIETLIGGRGSSQGCMRDVPLDRIKEYAAEDADITYQLFELLQAEMERSPLKSLFADMEMPLIPVLADMEHTGVCLDTKALADYAQVLSTQIAESEQCIKTLAGTDFNVSSPKQVGEVLFERLKIDDSARKTKTGQYSTSEETLQKLAPDHPIVAEILNYRGLVKLLNTYVVALPKLVSPRTGRIHTSFNQTVVVTGRLSSSNPNLQNIPVRDAQGRELRKAFVATGDNVLMAADYSQVELRLMAHFSNDPHLVEAFRRGEDIHQATAARIFGVPPADVTPDMRRKAKTANFGIIYGISAFGLAERLNISRKEAKDIIDGYFDSFPDVRRYMDNCIATARDQGAVYTLYGRSRQLPDINSRNQVVRGMAERNAINAPIQGTAADIIKLAMIRVADAIARQGLRSKMIIQVHDELIFDVPRDEVDTMTALVRQCMETDDLLVPLEVNIGIGANWLEAH